MTKDEVIKRVKAIGGVADDDEAAHSTEDRLYEELLLAIAEGRCDDPRGCAQEALKSQDIDFERWCA